MTLISTIILNWNREHLLRRTVESYLQTTSGAPVELFIVDNASTDGSRDCLRDLEQTHRTIRVMYLDPNIGGDAFNIAIAETQGQLIHMSENDQQFLPGWLDHVKAAFDVFPDLGQLSLHHDVPEDDEAWEAKPSHLRFKAGKILYEAHGNVGTSSILRGEIFRTHGVKVQTLEQGPFKFPADGALSDDVKRLGYWVAWSDRYHVRNLGHLVEEFDAHPDYYRSNYESKPWLGEAGWRARVEGQRQTPKPERRSVVFPHLHALPEKTMGAVNGKPARIWSMLDGWTGEIETLDFLYALVRLTKPAHALETGTWLGWSACFIGRAMKANGFGKLTTLETSTEAHAQALKNLSEQGVRDFVDARLESSMTYQAEARLSFVLFDSDTSLREAEFRRMRPWLEPGAVVVFHDTGPQHVVVGEAVRRLVSEGALVGVELPTPRGIFVGRTLSLRGAEPADPRSSVAQL
jgi:glycosyltransferase involved in cell wall biosynthesis